MSSVTSGYESSHEQEIVKQIRSLMHMADEHGVDWNQAIEFATEQHDNDIQDTSLTDLGFDFSGNTPDELRRKKVVAVAKDVLEQMHTYILARGRYLAGTISSEAKNAGSDLRDILDVVTKTCTVCALGACLMSKARLYDAVPYGLAAREDSFATNKMNIEFYREHVYQSLIDLFEPKQLDLIESAFETRNVANNYNHQTYAAIRFGDQYATNRARLYAIMKNIIDNNGEFIPGTPSKE